MFSEEVVREEEEEEEEERREKRKMAITLNSGFKMPIIGLGVWRIQGQAIKDLVLNSIKLGYRHFDCAGKIVNMHLILVLIFDDLMKFIDEISMCCS